MAALCLLTLLAFVASGFCFVRSPQLEAFAPPLSRVPKLSGAKDLYSSSSFTSPRAAFAFSMIFSCNCVGTTS